MKKSLRVMFITVTLSLMCISTAYARTKATKAQMIQWFNNTYAILMKQNGYDLKYFAGQPAGTYGEISQYRLAQGWNIKGRKDAINTIEWLIDSGDREKYRNIIEWLKNLGYFDMEENEKNALLKELLNNREDGVKYYNDMMNAYKSYGEDAIDAWDYCRAVQVAGEAYLAGYFIESEAYDYSLMASEMLQRRFSSWDAMVESYCIGAEFLTKDINQYDSRKKTYQELKNASSNPYALDFGIQFDRTW